MKTLLMVLLIATAQGLAQENPPSIMRGDTIFIREMPSDLDGYIRAEFFKQKVPLRLVLDEKLATLIMMGNGEFDEKRKWHEGWLTPIVDHAVGNVMVMHKDGWEPLWAAEAGDRSLWWGSMARGGMRKVAQRIVHKMKKEIH